MRRGGGQFICVCVCVCVCAPRTVRLWQATSSNSLLSCCFLLLLLPPLFFFVFFAVICFFQITCVCVCVCFFPFLCSLPFVRHSCCCSSLVGCAYLNVLHSLLPGTRPRSAARPSFCLSVSFVSPSLRHSFKHAARHTHTHTQIHTLAHFASHKFNWPQ